MSEDVISVNNAYNTSHITHTTTSWEEAANFWIEGVLTPVVSLGGLVGKS